MLHTSVYKTGIILVSITNFLPLNSWRAVAVAFDSSIDSVCLVKVTEKYLSQRVTNMLVFRTIS